MLNVMAKMSKFIILFCLVFVLKFDALPSQEILESKDEAEYGSENEFRTLSGPAVVCKVPTRKANMLSRLKDFVFGKKSTSAPLHNEPTSQKLFVISEAEYDRTYHGTSPIWWKKRMMIDATRATKKDINSKEMLVMANQLPSEDQADFIADFYKRRLATKNEIIATKDEESDLFVFFISSCVIKDEFNLVYNQSVKYFDASQLFTKPIEAPPEEVRGQIYDKDLQGRLITAYKKWLPWVKYDLSSFAQCIRSKLTGKGYSHHQMAWSAPKVWKFYNRYNHPSDSPAVVSFEKYMWIRNMALNNEDITNIETAAEYQIYKSIQFNRKSFLDILEEYNSWFITIHDCHMINILRTCQNKVNFICRRMKNYTSELVVPLFPKNYGEMPVEQCNIHFKVM